MGSFMTLCAAPVNLWLGKAKLLFQLFRVQKSTLSSDLNSEEQYSVQFTQRPPVFVHHRQKEKKKRTDKRNSLRSFQ